MPTSNLPQRIEYDRDVWLKTRAYLHRRGRIDAANAMVVNAFTGVVHAPGPGVTMQTPGAMTVALAALYAEAILEAGGELRAGQEQA